MISHSKHSAVKLGQDTRQWFSDWVSVTNNLILNGELIKAINCMVLVQTSSSPSLSANMGKDVFQDSFGADLMGTRRYLVEYSNYILWQGDFSHFPVDVISDAHSVFKIKGREEY